MRGALARRLILLLSTTFQQSFLRPRLYLHSASIMESSTAKLEPFLLMAKSAKGAAAAKLVQDATAAPGVYVFSELLDLPSIKEVV